MWAPDLVKHGGRYYIYFPGIGQTYRSNYVIWSDNIRGPWSDPIDLKIGRIDPGHAVGPDKRGPYYYMVLAEGGTAGPPTGHMVVAARSTSIEGPWENSPYNPIVPTQSATERWWSKGHGTLVEGRDGRWHVVYHAYEYSST